MVEEKNNRDRRGRKKNRARKKEIHSLGRIEMNDFFQMQRQKRKKEVDFDFSPSPSRRFRVVMSDFALKKIMLKKVYMFLFYMLDMVTHRIYKSGEYKSGDGASFR